MFKDAKSFYYSVASLGSLFLIVLGLFSILNAGSQMLILKKDPTGYSMPPVPAVTGADKIKERVDLTEIQKEDIDNWLRDYETWKKQVSDSKIQSQDYFTVQQLMMGLSFLVIGVPLFLYHIRYVLKDK